MTKDLTTLTVADSVKLIRETLCVALATISLDYDGGRREEHVRRLQRLINECDRHRPLGPNGKHDDLHTPTCGCDDGEVGRG